MVIPSDNLIKSDIYISKLKDCYRGYIFSVEFLNNICNVFLNKLIDTDTKTHLNIWLQAEYSAIQPQILVSYQLHPQPETGENQA